MSGDSPSQRLAHCVGHLAHLLPAQGPIGVFIHHNTLHAFQHLPFERAVTEAARLFDAEPYMREEAYRDAFANGRIKAADVEAVLLAEGRDLDIRRVMLTPGVRRFAASTIRWELEENLVRTTFRSDAPRAGRPSSAHDATSLFYLCLAAAPGCAQSSTLALRPRDGIRERTGVDSDEILHPLLIKLAGAFLDQGLAYWPMPNRDAGFWKASLAVLGQPLAVRSRLITRLPEWIARWERLPSEEAVLAALEALGVAGSEWSAVLQAELLALPGWPGLMYQLERDPSLAPHERVPASLMDFIAVRLLLTVAAASSLGDPRAWRVPLTSVDDPVGRQLVEAATLFDVAQLLGLRASDLEGWDAARLDRFHQAVLAFDEWERRRVWHAAYERRHERQILLPLRQHRRPAEVRDRVAAHVIFCIDEREESIRRHLEEVDDAIETLGAAGFFGVAMNYTGLDDAHGVALCPVVVKPQHAVMERPAAGHESVNARRQVLRRSWARLSRGLFVSSRTLVRGWIGTTVLGVFSLIPLAARVLGPRTWSRWTGWLNDSVLPEARTELTFMRSEAASHEATEGLVQGFTVAEKVERVASVLEPAGLRKGMARLVIVLGHGSTSLNNPHESAHDCGACGGRRGGPNARIFAAMANHPQVRAGLKAQGIRIPEDTWFVGGYHDTCSDAIDLYDLEEVPSSHGPDLDRVRAALDAARARSAHERTRRFGAASHVDGPDAGLRHVQARAEHLAEPRPEYGHCTNAVCIVGPRSSTRGLFFDRRAFLVSYDAMQDPDDRHLVRLLGAVIPVCAGINLEYYFSFVDNERYGCGTKLPHNVTGLVGVMNGFESDLRTGLPWQMVEIHEPVRILFVIESTPERVLPVIRQNPQLWEFLANRWIRLAVVDPADSTRVLAYRGDEQWEIVDGEDEVLGHAASSLEWYGGRSEHLPLAWMQPSGAGRVAPVWS